MADSLDTALKAFFSKEKLEGMTSAVTGLPVEAEKEVKLQKLPEVLILQLKCFSYTYNGITKIKKRFRYPVNLELDKSKFPLINYLYVYFI